MVVASVGLVVCLGGVFGGWRSLVSVFWRSLVSDDGVLEDGELVVPVSDSSVVVVVGDGGGFL